MEPAPERGLLDLSVELSTRDIRAGNHFAIFVLIKNPFDKPVWLRPVRVSLPIELELTSEEELKRVRRFLYKTEKKQDGSQKLKQDEQHDIIEKINGLQQQIAMLANGNTGDIKNLSRELTWKIDDIERIIKRSSLGSAQVFVKSGTDLKIGDVKIGSKDAQVHIEGEEHGTVTIENLNVYVHHHTLFFY